MSTTKIRQQNLSLELVKVIAAALVALVHFGFPGKLGVLTDCLGRFTMPFFFGISGYYSLGIQPGKIKKRIANLLNLHLISAIIGITINCIGLLGSREDLLYYLRYETLPDLGELTRWLLIQENPYGGPLWYLTSLLLCYLILWGYTLFRQGQERNYGPLYLTGASLFCVFWGLSLLLPLAGMPMPFMAYRNGWLMGFPLFCMGLFLHEYQERLVKNFGLTDRRLFLLVLLGLSLSLLQCFGGYPTELPFGMILLGPALLLYLLRHPSLTAKDGWLSGMAARFGVLSTAMYLLHIAMMDLYHQFLEARVIALAGEREAYLMPVICLGMTVLASLVWERVDWLLTRKK